MIAYLILVHRYPHQFKRLFRAIYNPTNYYVVHVDKKSGAKLRIEIQDFLSSFPNTLMLQSENAVWGGYSLINIELRGIEELLKMGSKWKFFINLSAQDFPLMSQKQIQNFLNKNTGKDFIKIADQKKYRSKTLSRIQNFVIEFGGKIYRTPIKRPFIKGVTPYIGNQWMILTRKFCEFVSQSPEINKFKGFYKHTFIPDEGFFQTVIMNTSYKGDIVNDDKRIIDWVPMGIIKLRPRDFVTKDATYLFTNNGLFARKFDETVDARILKILESHLLMKKTSKKELILPIKRQFNLIN